MSTSARLRIALCPIGAVVTSIGRGRRVCFKTDFKISLSSRREWK